MEDQDLPSWIADIRDQQPGEEPPVAGDLQAPMDWADAAQPPWGRTDRADVMEDLREQVIEAGEPFDYEEKPSLPRFFRNLKPWQRLTLAVLLFLDVAVCGCMALAMAGRVMPPF